MDGRSRIVSKINIGGIELDGKVLSAPFSGISNSPFRVLARQHGASLVFTEMVKANAWLIFKNRPDRNKAGHMVSFKPEERPVFAQIASGDPDEAAEATELAFASGFDGIDLNMGCPVKKMTKSKCGAYLMSDPELAGEVLGAMERTAAGLRTSARPFPVTAKIRAGLSSDRVNAPEIARRLRQNGCAALIIHARTKDQIHSGETKWKVAKEVKESLDIPIFYNGSINSPQIARRAVELSGCDGVMIGRASFGNPWVFGRVERYLSQDRLETAAPTIGEVKETLIWHFGAVRGLFGDHLASRMMRRYGCWYIHGVKGGAKFRYAMSRLESADQFEELVEDLFGRFDPALPAPLADWYDAASLSRHEGVGAGTVTAGAARETNPDPDRPRRRDDPTSAPFAD